MYTHQCMWWWWVMPRQAQIGNGKMFFEECEIYWDPALNREDLYAQLACRKYREIPSHRIR